MNVVQEIKRINQRELDLGTSGSWHDDYKDSAYIFAGGLPRDLTEGDVISIFSQYGEIMNINMPRDKETGKPKGFAFLMYEDQRSTILAVDNLNGATILERTIRVDHVKNYKEKRIKNQDGEWVDPEEQSLNARPEVVIDDAPSESEKSDIAADIDPEDPMRDFIIAQRLEERAGKKKKSKKHKDETPEERRVRKERKREKRAKRKVLQGRSDAMRGVEELLKSLGVPGDDGQKVSPRRSRSRSPSSSRRDRHRSGRSRSPGPYSSRPRRRGSSGSRSPRG
ncbi:hypothetical protein BJ322DRAFT_1074946 [Thelephora terrestris]|uniref:RRM domain-containing protein n=1 Tax=Thelephora terrestris TaxID=56493 RepID=A0A9P6L4S4_9AGAM|nr:hypothetical protein BJ322DRAFT_1074946 [Thelephora terrestris]